MRTVRRLRVRGDSEASIRRWTRTFEDALRVASLPDHKERILVVRRVELPRVRACVSSQALAAALEAALTGSETRWVHAMDPAAETASAIWFANQLELHMSALAVVDGPRPLAAWYWRQVLPAVVAAGNLRERLRCLALSLAEVAEAPIALPVWIDAVVVAGWLPQLAASFGPGEPERISGIAAACGKVLLQARRETVPIAWQDVWPTKVADSTGRYVEVEVPPVRVATAAVVPCDRAGTGIRGGKASSIVADATAFRPVAQGDDHRYESEPSSSVIAEDAPPQAFSAGTKTGIGSGHGATVDGRPAANRHALPMFEGVPTRAGGLPFLLTVLGHLGYAHWLRAHPEWEAGDIARVMLAGVLRGLRLPDGDPAWRLAASDFPSQWEIPRNFVAPVQWRRLARRPLRHVQCDGLRSLRDASERWTLAMFPSHLLDEAEDWPPASAPGRPLPAWHEGGARVAAVAASWQEACRRWLRWHARMGIAGIVRRDALITVGGTHVDCAFDLRDVDIRLRRAGLDLDPGWLPWFGRVVGYRYLRLPGG